MHSLILGQTESGKTCFAKILAREYVNAGKHVAVLDPICDPKWKCAYRTKCVSDLTSYLEKNRSVYVFIDESGQIFNEGNDMDYSWLTTRSRHFGHSVHLLSQRAVQIPKTMRDQCSRLFLFTSGAMDGKIHAEEWNKPILANCNVLPQLEFFSTGRFSDTIRYKLEDYNKVKKLGNTTSVLGKSNRCDIDNSSNRKMDKRKGTQ